MVKDVAVAKIQQPDVIIAFVHRREQYSDLPVQSQKDWLVYLNPMNF